MKTAFFWDFASLQADAVVNSLKKSKNSAFFWDLAISQAFISLAIRNFSPFTVFFERCVSHLIPHLNFSKCVQRTDLRS